jgi:hypothetical protein
VYPVLAYQVGNRVEKGQQHDQGRYDPRDETDEHLSAGLEEPDEPLASGL